MVSRLKTYWAAPVFEDTEKTRIACLLNITLIAISAVAFALTLVDGLIGVADVRVLLVGLITALLPLVLRFVMKRGHVRFASLLLSSLFLVNVTLAVYFAGTIRSPLSTIYIVGIVIAGLMVSYRAAIVFTVLSALALLGLLQAETAGLLNPISVTVGLAQWFAYVATFIVVTVLVGLTISSINEAFERARRNETALSRTVTELQVTTERLRQAEAKYRTLVEHVPAITYIDVPDEKVACGYRSVYVSPQIEDILGYTADEFRADADLWPQLMHPDDRETALTRDARHFETGLPMRQEYRVFARSGRLVWLRDAAVAVRDEAGNIQFSQGIQFDITERKQAEETLQHSEARYRAVIEQSKDCIFLVDVDSKSITEANPAMQRLLGYTPAEIERLTLYDVVAHDRDSVDRHTERILADGYHFIGERQYYRKDGTKVDLEVGVSVISCEGKLELCVVSREIGERKQAQAALMARARQQAVIAELGQRGLVSTDLAAFMDEVATLMARTLEVDYVSILELLPDRDQLLLRAGEGWPQGLVGTELLEVNGTLHESGYTLLSNLAVVVDDFGQEKRFEQSALLRDHAVVSSANVVIHGQRRPAGILSVHAAKAREFSEDNIHFLQAAANVLATIIEHTQAKAEIDRRQQELRALQSAGAAITSSLDLHEVLESVAEAICSWLGVAGCTISEWNPADDTITTMIDFGRDEWTDNTAPGPVFRLVDYPLTKRVLAKRQAQQITVDQADADPSELAYIRQTDVQSLLMLPMVFRDQVVGLVEIVDNWSSRNFVDQEIALGQLLANQAASAIRNARLYEQAQQDIAERKRAETEIIERNMQLLILQSAGAAIISSLDLQDVLDTVAREMTNLLDITGCIIYEWNQIDDTITIMLEIGPESWLSHERVGETFNLADYPLTKQVLVGRCPQQMTVEQPHIEPAELAYMQEQDFKTLLMLPMVYQTRVVGLLEAVDDDVAVTFTKQQISLGQLLANQAASAIENARLFAEVKQQAAELSTLLDVAQAVSSTLDLEEVLNLIVDLMVSVTGSSGCTISRWDEELDVVMTWVESQRENPDHTDDPGTSYALADFPATRDVIETGQPLNVLASDSEADPAEVAQMRTVGVTSLLLLPLVVGERVIGLVELEENKRERIYTPPEIHLCQALTHQAAIAIHNAQLYAESQQRLAQQSAFREAGAVISSTLDLETVLSLIAEQIGQVIDATSAYICGFTPETKLVRVLAEYISPHACLEEKVSDLDVLYVEDDATFIRSLELNQPSSTHLDDPDLRPSDREHMGQYGAKSILFVPFQVKERPIGFAELWESRLKREFSPEEVDLCQALADQAAIAIEQARLFEQAQQEIGERKRAEKIIKASLKEKEVLLQEIHHRVKNNMQVISSLLNLQSGYVKDPQILEILADSQNRVRSMALIHEKLYRSENLARIDFGEYIRDLAAFLFRSHGARSNAISLEIEADDVFLDIDTAVPCGLILNELVSNSLKHAFPTRRSGELLVELRAGSDGRFELNVSDNGIGFPQELDFQNLDSLGLQLVISLVEQLDGTIELDRGWGTKFTIRFHRSSLSDASEAVA